MKKSVLFFALLGAFMGKAQGQDCSELFISEYLEGLSNNKALEIYNPTNQVVDLSGYFVVRYDNGNANPTVLNAIQLRGTIAPYDVHVGVLDKRNPDGEGQEAPIWDDLQAKADEFYCPDYNASKAFYWNGNDAVVLFKGKIPEGTPLAMPITSLSNVKPVDIFGKIGENPGEASQGGGWTYDGTPAGSGGAVVSADHFLVRKPGVKKGVTANPATLKINEEWDSLSFFVFIIDGNGDTVLNNQGNPARRMNVDNLGTHDCDCNLLSVSATKTEKIGFDIFPNPVENKQINILSADKIENIVITNSLGQVVQTIPNVKPVMLLHLNVNAGVYFMTARGANGMTLTKKFIVK